MYCFVLAHPFPVSILQYITTMAVVVVASSRPAVAAKAASKASVPKVFSKEQKVCVFVRTCPGVACSGNRSGMQGACPFTSISRIAREIPAHPTPLLLQLAIAGTAASIATALAPAAQAAQEVAMTAEVRPLHRE